MRKLSVLIGSLLLTTTASAANDLRERANAVFKPIPDQVSEVRGKPVSQPQAVLGHKLWFDPRLSSSHVISCNSCHNLAIGGSDNVPTSIGHGWQKGPRNSPTVLNAVFNAAQFWDGRAKDLQEQAKGPVQASVEMNSTPERVVATLKSIPEYVAEFEKAFPNDKDPVSFDNMAYALEAFEVSLVTPNSPFDRFLAGDDAALDAKQKQGLALFMDSGCAACHNGVNVGGQGYFPFGVIKNRVRDSARGRQGAICRNQHRERRIRISCRTAAQRRADSAVLSQRGGLGAGAGRGDHGRQSAGTRTQRRRSRCHHRLPAQPDRRTAQGSLPPAAGEHRSNAQAALIVANRMHAPRLRGAVRRRPFSPAGRSVP